MKKASPFSFFTTLPAALRRILVINAVLLVLITVTTVLMLLPQIRRMRVVGAEHDAASAELTTVYANLSEISNLRRRVAETETELARLREDGVLEPLLGSYEMRALRQVAPLAAATGLRLLPDTVRGTTQLPIQAAGSITGPLYKRQVIEFAGSGSYEQIAAFVRAVETTLPMVSVASVRILGQRTPEVHAMLVALEWPVLAEKTGQTDRTQKR